MIFISEPPLLLPPVLEEFRSLLAYAVVPQTLSSNVAEVLKLYQ